MSERAEPPPADENLPDAPAAAPAPAPTTTSKQLEPKQEPELEEGLRATQLRGIFTRALDRSIGTCSYENFAKCFPTFAKNRPTACRHVWEQMTNHWRERAWFEYHAILKERNVIPSLNELDELLRDAELRRRRAPAGYEPVAPSTLAPQTIVEAHLTPLLQNAANKVNSKLEAVQADNDTLMENIVAQRKEMKELYEQLATVSENWGKTVETVQQAVGTSEKFFREMDVMPGPEGELEIEMTG